MASLAKLTSLSTQTLSLLLERQRLQSLPGGQNGTVLSLHLYQVTRNLQQLHVGILEMEQKEGRTDAVNLMRSQFGRMRDMLGPEADAAGVPTLKEPDPPTPEETRTPSPSPSPSPPSPPARDNYHVYTPYTDDPEAGYAAPDQMLHAQRQIMDQQDDHLDRLSQSINRQRDLSLQIGDELEVHTGLLEELDTELDRTDSRLTRARRSLDRVAKGARENGSTFMIALLILVLLILIIVFKT
ncbi:hypothetical protein OBBRIDRAFT_835206 [Obba rivulosa]|uniref:t-SNARE coiled-coil homology domain-containing protein n=1 Tax=Obba rivulosa TaxID=1052685 RepID=A0A8E2DLT7_9APHY|nr:hypothetical protein OBBRIDRAFT_835206 [Obba rivulosa]